MLNKEIYLYTTKTFFKNGQQIGHTELYSPKFYGGAFAGIIVNGMLISGRKSNGEFISDECHCCAIRTPTAEFLARPKSSGRRDGRQGEAAAEVVCETRGYPSTRDACIESNQVGETEVARLEYVRLENATPRQIAHGSKNWKVVSTSERVKE